MIVNKKIMFWFQDIKDDMIVLGFGLYVGFGRDGPMGC